MKMKIVIVFAISASLVSVSHRLSPRLFVQKNNGLGWTSGSNDISIVGSPAFREAAKARSHIKSGAEDRASASASHQEFKFHVGCAPTRGQPFDPM